MANITITINTPVLTGGDYFKVRYRPVGGAYSSYQNEDNNPFQLTGLVAGQYEMEVIFVKGGVECPATVHLFTVTDPYTCVTFTPVIVQNGNLFDLSISYPAHTTPPCGWHIHISGATTNKIVNYASLPASPLLIPVANEGLQVTVYADLCSSKQMVCLDTDVPSITPTCTPMAITSDTLVYNNQYPNGFYGMSLVLAYTQSNPPSQFITAMVQQINVTSGVAGQTSYPNFTLGPIVLGNSSVSIPIVMNNNVVGSLYEVNWLVVDGCNQTHTGYASLLL